MTAGVTSLATITFVAVYGDNQTVEDTVSLEST